MGNAQGTNGKAKANPKQLVAVGMLALLLAGVGVWQWTHFSSPSTQNAGSKQSPQQSASAPTKPNPSTPPSTGIVLPALSARDPFKPTFLAKYQTSDDTNKVVVNNKTPAPPKREITGVPPITLPAENLRIQPSPNPDPKDPAPADPEWVLVGVVEGPNTVAIINDSEGHRRFVRVGDRLEEGWRVQKIERGRIVFKKNQEQKSLRVGQSTREQGGSQ